MLDTNDNTVKQRVGLLNLADKVDSISKAREMTGVSGDTFYRYKEAADEGGIDSLQDRNRRVPNHEYQVDPAMAQAVIDFADEELAYGQVRGSDELRKCGVTLWPSAVRLIWLRYDLANFKSRLKALDAAVAAKG